MYKECFDQLSRLRNDLNVMEDEIKELGHKLGTVAGVEVNQTLSKVSALRGCLWSVDRVLEKQRG